MLDVCKIAVQALGRFDVRCISFFGGIKHAEMISFPVSLYVSDEPTAPFFTVYALIAASVVALKSAIAQVFGRGCEAQITPAVVRAVKIFVVNFVRRPFVFYVQPSKTVGHILYAVYGNLYSSARLGPASYFTDCAAPREHDFPGEFTCRAVIAKHFAQAVHGQAGVRIFVPPHVNPFKGYAVQMQETV